VAGATKYAYRNGRRNSLARAMPGHASVHGSYAFAVGKLIPAEVQTPTKLAAADCVGCTCAHCNRSQLRNVQVRPRRCGTAKPRRLKRP
jgi:hypothetical protein